MNWSGPHFDGDSKKFKFPYLEDWKCQLRAINTLNIASNIEKKTAQNISPSSNGIPDKCKPRVLDKIDIMASCRCCKYVIYVYNNFNYFIFICVSEHAFIIRALNFSEFD